MDSLNKKKKAVLINSGIANAFTGRQGQIDAELCINKLSNILNIDPSECYIGSTGVIGQKLKIDSIVPNIENLAKNLSKNGAEDYILATMTTDTRVKQASVSFYIDNNVQVNIAACVKGSGMIMPDMATMLCTVITDISISHEMMKKSLHKVVEDTLNCITVDGDTSTNDSVFFLSNGLAGNNKIISEEDVNYKIYYEQLSLLLEHMAKELIKDGEGITKFITINVLNTPTREKAKLVGMSVANSPLVKTALFGSQLNWGRIIMAAGKAGSKMDFSKLDMQINNYPILERGEPIINPEKVKIISESLKGKDINISLDFNQGNQKIRIWTCDYSYDYIKINAGYLS